MEEDDAMLDRLFNAAFGCRHQRTSFPLTPLSKAGEPQKETYIVCLNCGKQFVYDWKEMRIGPEADLSMNSQEIRSGAVPTHRRAARSKFRYLLWGSAVPAAWFLGRAIKTHKRTQTQTSTAPNRSQKERFDE